jgi:galactokinase/mevalonate kinase-like predicted kinase
MKKQLHNILENISSKNMLPEVIAYNRIDGPGSSLDLREFQQAFWVMPDIPKTPHEDPALSWTNGLPRTIGITINTGTKIQALPFESDKISVRSIEYGTEVVAKPGEVPPVKENWLLKIIELFGLVGVQFVLHNLQAGTQSSGLGGSATATTGVCILANELAERPFSSTQLVSLASRMEQDLGVSLTGTQEQSNVVFGGVTDYVWFPWGIPNQPESGYGHSIRRELLLPEDYPELEARMAIFHTGITRASTDVNSVWTRKLMETDGFRQHHKKLEIAYQFREGLRLKRWEDVITAIKNYQEVRTDLCVDYMEGTWEIQGFAEEKGCTAFPLGAGGGGGVLLYGPDPNDMSTLRQELKGIYREIPYRIQQNGHDLINLPIEKE